MQFRTTVPITPLSSAINYQSHLVLMGSCFAENMGERSSYFKFSSMVNPFGIIFNPVSLENIISRSVTKQYFTADDLFFHNDLWHSFEVHSDKSNTDSESLLTALNTALDDLHEQLCRASHCLITLGTAWVYRSVRTGAIVANCHKVPQREFTKELLSVVTIENHLAALVAAIQSINPNIAVVMTVSPVRHSKDGFMENNRSKAHLITALHQVIAAHPEVYYFPSYEIVMDELRDYRFYAQDMLHPSPLAIDYIWERFTQACITPASYPIMKEVDAIQKALQHRPFNPSSPSHLQFLNHLQQKIQSLQDQHPTITF
jgi:hypothetical protein